MKLEILFRGKQIDNNEWIYGSYVKTMYNSFIIPLNDETVRSMDIVSVFETSVCQFTGLVDKVKCRYFAGCIGEYFNCKFVVVWDNGWYAEFIETKKKRNLSDFCDETINIGNIFDNPELLNAAN